MLIRAAPGGVTQPSTASLDRAAGTGCPCLSSSAAATRRWGDDVRGQIRSSNTRVVPRAQCPQVGNTVGETCLVPRRRPLPSATAAASARSAAACSATAAAAPVAAAATTSASTVASRPGCRRVVPETIVRESASTTAPASPATAAAASTAGSRAAVPSVVHASTIDLDALSTKRLRVLLAFLRHAELTTLARLGI